MNDKIAILIPCHNEESSIGKVVADFKREIPEATVYVFDNASTDETAKVASEAGAIVMTERRKGKGNVVRKMFNTVDADIYVMVDGDDTYPPKNVREVISPIATGEADMVIGDRLSSTYFNENKRPFHNFGNRLIRKLLNSIFDSNLHDVLSGYRAFSRKFVQNISIQSTAFEIETEITAYSLSMGFPVKEVVVPYKDRAKNSKSKLNTYKDGVLIIKTLFSLFRDFKPFKFFSTIASIIALFAISLLIPVFMDYFETGLVERFPTLIFGCFVLLSAFLFFCCGLILQVITNQNRNAIELIYKLNNRINNQPHLESDNTSK